MRKTNCFYKLFEEIKSIFLNGLLTVLPITLTFLLLRATFRILEGWLEPVQKITPKFLQNLPHSDLFFVTIFIFIIGIVLKFFILKRIIHSIEESIVYRIPIIKSVYSGLKQLLHGLSQKDHTNFNKVVLVEFPKKELYSLGFLTGEFSKKFLAASQETYFSIFIPHTPNPITGSFILAPKKEIIEIDLTKQEAMSIIISGGIIKPKESK